MASYYKFYRSIIDHELLANDNNAYIVFTKLLARVDWKTGSINTGKFKLAALLNIKPGTLYGVLKRLEEANMIQQQPNNHFTKITVVNWKKYQQPNSNSTGTQDESKPINKNKRIKNKEIATEISFENKDLQEAFSDFEKMRKTIKKPMTDKAKQLIVAKLEKFYPNQINMQIKCLHQSIENCWQSIYVVKHEPVNVKPQPQPPEIKEEDLASDETVARVRKQIAELAKKKAIR